MAIPMLSVNEIPSSNNWALMRIAALHPSYKLGSTSWNPIMRMPTAIKLHKVSKTLELQYGADECYHLPAEFLRVHSPSAEVQGHGKPILQYGKLNVALLKLEPTGNYALKLTFDDGHDSGLFTWDYLYQLATRHDQLWQDYLQTLHDAGRTRDPETGVVRLML